MDPGVADGYSYPQVVPSAEDFKPQKCVAMVKARIEAERVKHHPPHGGVAHGGKRYSTARPITKALAAVFPDRKAVSPFKVGLPAGVPSGNMYSSAFPTSPDVAIDRQCVDRLDDQVEGAGTEGIVVAQELYPFAPTSFPGFAGFHRGRGLWNGE